VEGQFAYFHRRVRSESCLELARRHRLIGCAKRLPPDLSTNRDHFTLDRQDFSIYRYGKNHRINLIPAPAH
jgi:hypothetical protein